MHIGFDFSGFIVHGGEVGGKKSGQLCEQMTVPYLPGAQLGLRSLVRYFGPWNNFIVTRCKNEAIERSLRAWLPRVGFFTDTGILPAHFHVCRERVEKAHLCQYLGLHTYGDDRLQVLNYLRGIVRRRIFFQPEPGVFRHKDEEFRHLLNDPDERIEVVRSWDELCERLLPPEGRYEYAAE